MEKNIKRLIALAIVILFLLIVTLGALGIDYASKKCWIGHDYDESGICTRCGDEKLDEVKPDDKKDDDVEAVARVRGGAILSVPEGQNDNIEVALTSLAGSEDIPAAVAENSWTITVTKVEPASADNQSFDWSIRWKNADSAWATGKNVEEHCTITPDSDGAKEATMRNLKDFGEQIEIVVTSRDNPKLSKVVLIDYVQKITNITFNLPDIASTSTSFTYEFTTTEYTLKSELSLTVGDHMRLTTPFIEKYVEIIESMYSFEYGFLNQDDRSMRADINWAILKANQNIITIEADMEYWDSIFAGAPLCPSGVAGCFIAAWEQFCFDYMGFDGDVVLYSVFRQTVESLSTAHATFDITYKATYDGKDYSFGSKKVEVRFDGKALHIPVEDFEVSSDHVII